jgi:hypothetical protein
MYLRVWGWDPDMVAGRRYGMCASFSAPARRQKRPAGGQTPVKAKNKLQQNCLARINQVNGAASRVSLLSAIGF